MRRAIPIVLVLAVFLGRAWADEAARADVGPDHDGVAVYEAQDPEYLRLSISGSVRVAPDAPTRLVVFRAGKAVLDRGLLGESEGENGVDERAEVAADGGTGALLVTRGSGSEIVWIDPENPRGRFKVPVGKGRAVTALLPIARAAGLAVATASAADGSGDLRLYARDGTVRFTLPDTGATTIGVRATANGAFLAADLAFAGAREKDRGLLVLDLLHGASWTYAWSYGSEDEPLSWEILDSGVLEVRTPAAILRYDRSGTPIGTGPAR